MIAYESLNPSNRIEDAVCLSIAWGDGKPGLYVVPRPEASSYLAARKSTVSMLLDIEAMARARAGHWIGIKVANSAGVAAWGRAKVELAA